MASFFDRYRDLFEVDRNFVVPTSRLTINHPLFAEQSYTTPLKDLKFNVKPIDLTKELDSFESKLESWKKDKNTQL